MGAALSQGVEAGEERRVLGQKESAGQRHGQRVLQPDDPGPGAERSKAASQICVGGALERDIK